VTLLVGQSGSPARSPKRRHASRIAGLAAAVIAAVAFAGWRAGLPLLSSWGASLPATRPLAALCLLALGLALAYPGKNRRFAIAAGTAVAALVVFLLGTSLLSLDIGIPWLSLHVPVPILAPGGPAPGYRLAHVAALAFGLTGAALALSGWDRCRLLATAIAGIATAVVVFALLGYLTGIDALYGTVPLTAPPLPTAAGLLCVTLGVLLVGTMPTLRTPRPLWQLLAMLGCAIIGPLALFGAYAEVSISDAQIDLARKELMQGARAISADYDRQIAGEIGWLKALASSPSLHQGDYAAFQRQAEAAMKLEPAGDIVLFDRDLHQLVDTRTPDSSAMVRATVPELVEAAVATGKPQFTGLFREDVTGRALFAIVLPVEAGDNRYALMKSIGQSALTQPLAAENLPPGWQGVVSNGSSHVLAQTGFPAEDDEKGTVPPQSHGHRSIANGVFEFADAAGQPALAGYAVSELTGWETDVWEPKARFEAPVQALWRTLCWLALLSLGLVLGLALWLSRLIARSVGQAAGAATAPQYGGTLLPDGTPVAEVNTLMAELHEAAARREASERLLRDSEHQLRLIADNVPVAIVRCDVDGRCMFVNRLFVERHGVRRDHQQTSARRDRTGRIRRYRALHRRMPRRPGGRMRVRSARQRRGAGIRPGPLRTGMARRRGRRPDRSHERHHPLETCRAAPARQRSRVPPAHRQFAVRSLRRG
jgi:PAS domain-containing protein